MSKHCNVLHFLNNCSCIFNKGTFVISMLKHLLLKSILVKKNLDPQVIRYFIWINSVLAHFSCKIMERVVTKL